VDRLEDEREGYFRAQLLPGEAVLATEAVLSGSRPERQQAWVTDRRIVFVWRLVWPAHVDEWTHDAIELAEVTGWSEGKLHDQRPVLRIEHSVHRRLQWGARQAVPVVAVGQPGRAHRVQRDDVQVLGFPRPSVPHHEGILGAVGRDP
jgi:hypothetical protein